MSDACSIDVHRKTVNGETGQYGPLRDYGLVARGRRYRLTGDLQLIETGDDHLDQRGSLDGLTAGLRLDDYQWLALPRPGGSGSDRNLFSSEGRLVIKNSDRPFLSVPVIDGECQLPFGCRLLMLGDPLPVLDVDVRLVSYQINPGFVEGFVRPNGDFLERHPFPHLVLPLKADPLTGRSGHLLIGDRDERGSLVLFAVALRPGQMVYVPSNVVHSDWHVKGEYMTSMSTEPSHHGAADTVFLESDSGAKVYFQID